MSYGWQAKRRVVSSVARKGEGGPNPNRRANSAPSDPDRPLRICALLEHNSQDFLISAAVLAPAGLQGRARATSAMLRLHHQQSDQSPTLLDGTDSDIALRLADHNGGRSRHTATGRPWKFVVVVEFASERRAIEFEKYLKSGSGCAFSVRHFR